MPSSVTDTLPNTWQVRVGCGTVAESSEIGEGTEIIEKAEAAGWTYEGAWEHGVMSGQGLCVWMNGTQYMGAWQGGKRQGPGAFKVRDMTLESYPSGLCVPSSPRFPILFYLALENPTLHLRRILF